MFHLYDFLSKHMMDFGSVITPLGIKLDEIW